MTKSKIPQFQNEREESDFWDTHDLTDFLDETEVVNEVFVDARHDPLLYLAMWSGPRNISTAMMRAWENRPDTWVVDEPLYAHYLHHTDYDHPVKEAIIAADETDWRTRFDQLIAPIPHDKAIYYQKHMTHHWLPHMELSWLDNLTNCFLIREPREVITSYLKIRPEPTLENLGFPQQMRLFNYVRKTTGQTPPILDSRDVLENPRQMLTLLCEAVGVQFDERMLAWPAGKRETDGVWGDYWYSSVWRSMGWAEYRPKTDPVPPRFQPLLTECNKIYQQLYQFRLRA